MKKACLVVAPPYTNGAIFARTNSYLNRDNCLQFYYSLQDIFLEHGVDLNTHDVNVPDTCDFILYVEMPRSLPQGMNIKKSSLLIFECQVIIPNNWNVSAHDSFAKIFTWHDSLIDQKRYFKMNFTHDTRTVEFLSFREKKKFCTLIAGNKSTSHPLELYSHRKNTIRWFEKNHLDKFEFYGMGWDLLTFDESKITRILNRFSALKKVRRFLAEKYPSYKGTVKSKLETLRQYKFSICYENAQQIPGYITEKIFDSMYAGCIPVYWGAPNISDYVPDLCYIDKRKFETYEDLYHYLATMSETEYQLRLEHIKDFLRSASNEKFTPLYNAKSVAECILLITS